MLFRLEAIAVWVLYRFFEALPIDAASAVGGMIGRVIGTRLPVTQHARRNLARIFPDWSEAERQAVIVRMWDNIGRTAGEYPHIPELTFGPGQRVEIEGMEHFEALRDDGKPGLFFSGHFGNWEILGPFAARHGIPLHLIYRAATNPYVNWVYTRGRANDGVALIPKGAIGARMALEKLRRGEHIGMLVDQKMNDGIAVPFFGLEAMTAPALAAFAFKFKCPVVPAHIIRLGGAHFRIIFDPPMAFEDTGHRHEDVLRAMTQVNETLERWIRERPDHWLWLHKRWPEA
ncbi:lysophospholipid acyltransferase family protein [Telmatospirillum sp.]|uniref:lysophospholipid acyltransferase family protein n=1 Tax=Telmatospirillum sp. TaxID=2079197 RepID=UPI00283DBE94|nr:lysophospholipid acyltransferase family protein [Telmatospirillum sp.]MDR3435903.1 lysophospholipid acyltransferase family protein [Telmatospirillum sp.]